MNYLKFGEYIALGGVYDITAFNRNIDRACAVIDRYTMGRVAKMADVPLRVKALCRDLVEYYYTNSNISEKAIASKTESAGAVSESVSYVSKTNDDISFEIESLIYDHLYMLTDDNGTPLLYKGARM